MTASTCWLALASTTSLAALESGSREKASPLAAPPAAAAMDRLASCEERFRDLGSPPHNYRRRSLIALLPDPIGSPFAREFDLFFLALQQAMAREGFVQDEACLDWAANAAGRSGNSTKLPGVVLFRREQGADEREPASIYAVVLVTSRQVVYDTVA